MKLTFRKATPQEIEKAQSRCYILRLIFFKIPLYIWIGLVLIAFIYSKLNLATVFGLSLYPGLYVYGWLLLWHILTKDWHDFL